MKRLHFRCSKQSHIAFKMFWYYSLFFLCPSGFDNWASMTIREHGFFRREGRGVPRRELFCLNLGILISSYFLKSLCIHISIRNIFKKIFGEQKVLVYIYESPPGVNISKENRNSENFESFPLHSLVLFHQFFFVWLLKRQDFSKNALNFLTN